MDLYGDFTPAKNNDTRKEIITLQLNKYKTNVSKFSKKIKGKSSDFLQENITDFLDAYKYARLLKLATSLKEIIYLDQSNFEEKKEGYPNKNANALKEMALREATIDNLKLTVETYGRVQNPKFVSTLKFDVDTQIKPMWDSLMNETSNLVKILLEIEL